MAKILVVEDEQDISDLIFQWLKSEKHAVEVVNTGEEALDRAKYYKYDVIILDWNLPRMSGLDVCQQYRDMGGTAPILFLTAKQEIEAKERGLDAGSDDYLTKPFQVKELSARIRALMRRPPMAHKSVLKAGELSLDPVKRKVKRNDEEIDLIPKEFALLEFLMRHPGEVFSPDALIDRVWTSESDSSPEVIRTYIKRLRKKLDTDGKKSMLATVHGVGYRLDVEEELSNGD